MRRKVRHGGVGGTNQDMEKIRHATAGEVALYYWDREEAKGNFAPSGTERLRLPRGKCIEAASWTVVRLGTGELNGLVFLDSEPMRTAGLVKDDGPNFRLLGRVADRAVDMGYPASGDRGAQRHRDYLRQLEDGMAQTQFGMLILRELVHSERFSNPDGRFYIHDGNGRMLPYLLALRAGAHSLPRVEAFLAEGVTRLR